ncbi:MAG: terminase small subunit [Caulobacterales bacterium]|nr:terminase small subunit [Caulobacterales bacterium]MCA0372768.1 terminase small subunit [Pseudomonadota bacterium]
MKQQIEIQNCILSNPKHEKFAQSIARGLSQEKAYIEAGYKGDRSAASRMSTNVNILRRVKEIQNDTQLRNNIEIDDIIDELEKTRKLAMALGQCHSAFLASMGKARLLGLI